jgi:hypothetical protein
MPQHVHHAYSMGDGGIAAVGSIVCVCLVAGALLLYMRLQGMRDKMPSTADACGESDGLATSPREAQAWATVGIPTAPDPASRQTPLRLVAHAVTTDLKSSHHHTMGLSECAGPHVVARLEDVIQWMRMCPDGDRIDREPHSRRKPARLAMRIDSPPPFVMVSYTQQWCKSAWSKMAKVLEELHQHGWTYVWMDCVVLDDSYPYSQARFEDAMRFAVEQASAVYCPMTENYAQSLKYLSRPWCNYESRGAMRRGVLWTKRFGSFTKEGRRWTAAQLALIMLASIGTMVGVTYASLPLLHAAYRDGHLATQTVHVYVESMQVSGTVTRNPRYSPGDLFPMTMPCFPHAEVQTTILVYLSLFLLCVYAFNKCVPLMYQWLPSRQRSGGGSLMYDLGDAPLLGNLLKESSPARAVLEQMLLWHAEKWYEERQHTRFWMPCRPIEWHRIATSQEQRADGRWIFAGGGEVCRRISGNAPWLDDTPCSEHSWRLPQFKTVRSIGPDVWFLVVSIPSQQVIHSRCFQFT